MEENDDAAEVGVNDDNGLTQEFSGTDEEFWDSLFDDPDEKEEWETCLGFGSLYL